MAEEQGRFDFGDVVDAITRKLIRRHPHVFGDARDLSSDEVKALWGRVKADEKRERAEARRAAGLPAAEAATGALAGVPLALPALTRALKLQEKAGKVGFDWNDPRAVLAKLREEIDEVEAELEANDAQRVAGEVGDLLFAVANLARHLHVDPEAALRGANAKFERRFAHIESRLGEAGRAPTEATLDEMEALWREAKQRERKAP
jgi:ATP diphosphatase